MTATDLASLGWDASFAASFEPYAGESARPGRVIRVDRGRCHLLTESGAAGGDSRGVAAGRDRG